MIVSKYISEEISASTLPNAPNPKQGVVKHYTSDGIELYFCKNTRALGLSPTLVVPYALVAFNEEGEYLFAVSLEQTDLRELSSFIAVSVKQLQEEEGVKGFLTLPHLVMYGDGRREDLGIYPKNLDDSVIDDLLEYAIDSLDLISDPKEV